jgi:anaerobic sulfite reductase subunit B
MVFLPKPYKIESSEIITDNVKLIRVKSDMNPTPGKFFEVSIPGVGEAPLASCSYDDKNLDILIRNAGNVTSKLFELSKGDEIFIRGPYGKGFPLEELKGHNLILVAGGTGIAPVTSLIDYIEKNKNDFGEIIIYFGFRNEENILLKDKIKKWSKLFKVQICLDETSDNSSCVKGFVNEVIERQIPSFDKQKTRALMCGPEIMMEAVSKTLNGFGVKNNQIYWSMERRMECAFGSCGRCLIQDVYVCKDGPVFRYDFIKSKLENEERSNEYHGK